MIIVYTCAMCLCDFQSDWTDEEAQAEYKTRFPNHLEAEQVAICDDCDKMFAEWFDELTSEQKARIEQGE